MQLIFLLLKLKFFNIISSPALLTDSASYIEEELKLVQAELSSLKEVCSKIERELQLVESLEGL